jgi:hypothetical protein
MMMMTSLMPYNASTFANTGFQSVSYNSPNRYLPNVLQQTVQGNCFPSFGTTAGFPSLLQGYNQQAYHGYPQQSYPNQCYSDGNNGWLSIIQLVLGKFLNPAQAHPETAEEAHSTKKPRVTVHHTNEDDITKNTNVIHRKKRIAETNTAKKADLPQGISPLSYDAMQNDTAYRTEAVDAVKEWQAHLSKHGKHLDTASGRKQWMEGAINYLALLNNPQVRDDLTATHPSTIGTYYNGVLRTLREDKGVRKLMLADSDNAKILAVVDKTNQAIFGHRIFKNEA